jgi:hypothetical protein
MDKYSYYVSKTYTSYILSSFFVRKSRRIFKKATTNANSLRIIVSCYKAYEQINFCGIKFSSNDQFL